MFSKKLRHLGIEVEELEDDAIYSCTVRNKKKKEVEEPVEISGKELKILAEMQGQKYGMIRYSSELFYDVVGKKEEASI